MTPLIAFFDANVLYPAGLRSFLMYLALTGAFHAKWSSDVHEEWISNLLINRPGLTRRQLERTRRLMDKNAYGAVVKGYESLIPGLTLPDPDDRHVLAAAIRAGANIIVTKNLKDFPLEVVQKFKIEPQHPDVFILHLIDLAPEKVRDAAEAHRKSLKKPPKTVEEYLTMLELQGIPQTVLALRPLLARA
jgi:predicted nucleic acid-binding protein